MSGVFSYLGGSIDAALATFVTKTSAQVAAGIAPVVTVGLSIYFLIYGYAVMRNEVSDPINVFVAKALKISFILACSVSGAFYQSNIVGFFQGWQDGLVSIVQTSNPNLTSTATAKNMYEVLDNFDDQGTELALVILGRGISKLPVGGWLDLIAGIVVFVGNTVFLLIAGGLTILAKVASAIVLALGPLFIVSLAFPATQKFFDAWLSKIINYILLAVILAVVVSISVAICTGYMEVALDAAKESTTNQISDAFSLILLYGSLLLIIYQAPHIASGLAGGASLSGGGAGQFLMGMIAGRSGNRPEPKPPGTGGSIEGQGTGSRGTGGPGSGGNPPKVPAYKRASSRKYGSNK